jgi:hypothetical protein
LGAATNQCFGGCLARKSDTGGGTQTARSMIESGVRAKLTFLASGLNSPFSQIGVILGQYIT